MKRVSPKTMLIGASVAISALMLHSCWVRMHAIERFVCAFDEHLSPQTKERIEAQLTHQLHLKPFEIISFLLSRFTCIEHASLRIEPNKDAVITMKAQRPLVRVNEQYILSSSARLIPVHDFESSHIANLMCMKVAPEILTDAQALQELTRHMKEVEPTLLQEFNVMWHKSHEVVLTDVHNPLIQYVFCAHQLADHPRIQLYIDQVAHLMIERGVETAQQKKQLIADVRFENQVILRGPAMSGLGKNVTNGSKGGIQHGTRIS